MGRQKTFDRKFGTQFISNLPPSPGIYCFYNACGELVYVGKAKNLKNRLRQYRCAGLKKKDRKARKIIKQAHKVSFHVTESELEATLLEIRMIQSKQPLLNVMGTYSFLYPHIGISRQREDVFFCLTTHCERLPGFEFFGAFRSREMTGEAFFSFMSLLRFAGHRIKKLPMSVPEHTYIFGFRKLPSDWYELWMDFFRGKSKQGLEQLSLRLLDNAGARSRKEEVQENLQAILMFWQSEAKVLNEAIQKTGFLNYPVMQKERDPLFIKYRECQ